MYTKTLAVVSRGGIAGGFYWIFYTFLYLPNCPPWSHVTFITMKTVHVFSFIFSFMSMKRFGVPFCTLSWGPQHCSWLPFGKKAFRDALVKICEVIKGKVDYKWSFCFNYAQVSGNMGLLIKAFRELMITAVIRLSLGRNREPGHPTSCLWPPFQSTGPVAAPGPPSACRQAVLMPDEQHLATAEATVPWTLLQTLPARVSGGKCSPLAQMNRSFRKTAAASGPELCIS